MTRVIRPIETEDELRDFTRILLSAHPVGVPPFPERLEGMRHLHETDTASTLWGLWEDGVQIGNMRILDFDLNFDGRFCEGGRSGGRRSRLAT